MTNLVENIKDQITNVVLSALKIACEKGLLPQLKVENVIIEVPKDKNHGDFSTNVAMQITKTAKKAPREIAKILISCMNNFENTDIDSVEIAGPGFINFNLKKNWFEDAVKIILDENYDYGKINIGEDIKVMVEFISANPTGPMHMGNARGGAIGDCLSNILSWAGYDVIKEFYVNDAGNQIEKFAKSLEARYIELLKGEDAVEFPEDGYQGEDIVDRMKEFIKIEGDKYLEVDSDTRKKIMVEFSLNKNINKMEEDLKKYGIEYDVWFCESTLYENNEVNETVELLTKNGYTYEKEGAIWFKATEFGAEKDDVLVRNNGIHTYFAADIAYHRNKFAKRNFDKVINIWGADHHGHVARIKGAMDAVGCDSHKLEIIIMQLVRLIKDGETARMSKRTGKAITLTDLIEETGKDAARFFFNMRQAGSHMDFDLDLAVSQSDESPVFYVQYAHARICSIIRKLEEEGISLKSSYAVNVSRFENDIEMELIKKLIFWPEEIKNAALSMEPSKITRYVLDVAALFHSFYNSCRVKNEDDIELMMSRLALVNCVRIVLNNGLAVLGISAPEKM